MTTGSQITAAGLKTIQDKVDLLLGTGSGTRGYGQYVLSVDYPIGELIKKDHWDAIRYDIINILTHQEGATPSVISVNVGDLITYGPGSPNSAYDLLLETASANRFNLGPGQSVVTSRGTQSNSTTWKDYAYCVITLTFADANRARHFFNSGSKVRISSTRTGGSSTNQNTSWTNLLVSAGTKEFGAATGPVNFYTLTDSFQDYYSTSGTTPYSSNKYRLQARTPGVADNSSGTANVVELRVYFEDLYIDKDILSGFPAGTNPPSGFVDGTITVSIEELRAAGLLAPTGSFTISPPSYSVSSFTSV
jgi:hypothetical protein